MASSSSSSFKYTLQLLSTKTTLISETVEHLQSLPEVSKKCGILLESIQDELRIIISQIQALFPTLQQTLSKSLKQKQKDEHNYVVEFYDIKFAKMEATIDKLNQQKIKLESKVRNSQRSCQELEQQINSIRKTLISKETMFKSLQSQQAKENTKLREDISQLADHLEAAERAIQQYQKQLQELQKAKNSAERQLKAQRVNYGAKTCQSNKNLDKAKSDFMKLVKELEKDNARLRQQARDIQEALIRREYQIDQLQKKDIEKSNTIKTKEVEIDAINKQLSQVNLTLQKVSKQLAFTQDNKKKAESATLQTEQKAKKDISELQWELKKKCQQLQSQAQQQKKLTDQLSTISCELAERERGISFLRMRITQIQADKQMLLDEVEHKSKEANQLFRQVDLLNKFIDQDKKERQETQGLLKESYTKIEQFQELFLKSKTRFESEASKHKAQKQQIRREFEVEIQELIRINRELEGEIMQLDARVRDLQGALSAKETQVLEGEKIATTLKQQIETNKKNEGLIETKYRQAKNTWLALDEEMSTMRIYVKELEKRANQGAEAQHRLIIAQQEVDSLQQRLASSERELKRQALQHEGTGEIIKQELSSAKLRVEEKLKRANESLSQKQVEVVTLNTRVRNLQEQLTATKRKHHVEKSRLEARLIELERMIREKQEFQMKIQSAVFH